MHKHTSTTTIPHYQNGHLLTHVDIRQVHDHHNDSPRANHNRREHDRKKAHKQRHHQITLSSSKHVDDLLEEANRWRKNTIQKLEIGSHIAKITTGKIEYRVLGSHRWRKRLPVVLLLHGTPGGIDQAEIMANVQQLNDNYNLIAISRPGYLKSDIATGGLAVAEAISIISLLDHLEIQQVIIQGYAAGAISALYAAALAPLRVTKLILFGIGLNSQYINTIVNNNNNNNADTPLNNGLLMGEFALPRATYSEHYLQSHNIPTVNESKLFDDIQAIIKMAKDSTSGIHKRETICSQISAACNRILKNDILCDMLNISSYIMHSMIRKNPELAYEKMHALDTISNTFHNDDNDSSTSFNQQQQPDNDIATNSSTSTFPPMTHKTTAAHQYELLQHHPKQLLLMQEYLDTLLPLRDRFKGLVADIINMHLFWTAPPFISPELREDGEKNDDATTTAESIFPWSGVRTPTLIVQSPEDSIGCIQQAERVAQLLPRGHLLRLYNTGHNLWISPGTKIWRGKILQFMTAPIAESSPTQPTPPVTVSSTPITARPSSILPQNEQGKIQFIRVNNTDEPLNIISDSSGFHVADRNKALSNSNQHGGLSSVVSQVNQNAPRSYPPQIQPRRQQLVINHPVAPGAEYNPGPDYHNEHQQQRYYATNFKEDGDIEGAHAI